MGWIDAAIGAALIGAFGSVLVLAIDRYVGALGRKREKAAEALSDALLWLEMPYRIARRTSDEPTTINTLTASMHQLQERHLFHRAWLQVELPEAYEEYCLLLNDLRRQCGPHLTAAWERPPAAKPKDMNLGAIYAVDVESEIDGYVQAVRTALRPRWRRGR